MTLTIPPSEAAVESLALPLRGLAPNRQTSLVDQLVHWAEHRIQEQVFRPGMRMPSVRQLATDRSVSRFTVVQAYERLVARGRLHARRGSGFFVREPVTDSRVKRVGNTPPRTQTIDMGWLIRNMQSGIAADMACVCAIFSASTSPPGSLARWAGALSVLRAGADAAGFFSGEFFRPSADGLRVVMDGLERWFGAKSPTATLALGPPARRRMRSHVRASAFSCPNLSAQLVDKFVDERLQNAENREWARVARHCL